MYRAYGHYMKNNADTKIFQCSFVTTFFLFHLLQGSLTRPVSYISRL